MAVNWRATKGFRVHPHQVTTESLFTTGLTGNEFERKHFVSI